MNAANQKSLDELIAQARLLKEKGELAMKHAKESGNVDMEKEAQTYLAMFSKMISKHRLEMSDIEIKIDDRGQEEPIGRHTIDWTEHGHERVSKRQWWVEMLASIVAQAHGCQIMVSMGSNRITLVGRESSRRIVEYIIAILVRSAAEIAQAEYDKAFFAAKAKGELWKVRGFKASFLKGFVTRIAQRVNELKAQSGAIVLYNNDQKRVREFINTLPGIGKASGLVTATSHNSAGYVRGQQVANSVDLQGKAIEGDEARPTSAPKLLR